MRGNPERRHSIGGDTMVIIVGVGDLEEVRSRRALGRIHEIIEGLANLVLVPLKGDQMLFMVIQGHRDEPIAEILGSHC